MNMTLEPACGSSNSLSYLSSKVAVLVVVSAPVDGDTGCRGASAGVEHSQRTVGVPTTRSLVPGIRGTLLLLVVSALIRGQNTLSASYVGTTTFCCCPRHYSLTGSRCDSLLN